MHSAQTHWPGIPYTVSWIISDMIATAMQFFIVNLFIELNDAQTIDWTKLDVMALCSGEEAESMTSTTPAKNIDTLLAAQIVCI